MKLESNEFININIEHREQNEKEHIKNLLGLAETFDKGAGYNVSSLKGTVSVISIDPPSSDDHVGFITI